MAIAPATTRRLRLACLTGLIVGVMSLRPALVQAQEEFFLDDDAAMMSGAVAASVRGSGATWYNPAGLGAMEGHSVDLSASLYGLRRYDIADFLQLRTSEGTSTTDVGFTSTISVPSVLTFARELGGGLGFAVGVYVRNGDDLSLTARVEGDGRRADGSLRPASWLVSLAERTDESYFGAAIGWQVASSLRIGLSLFGVYASSSSAFGQNLSIGATGSVEEGDTALDFFELAVERNVGITARLGAQLDLDPVALGLVVRLPVLGVFQWNERTGNTATTLGLATETERSLEVVDEDRREFVFEQIVPTAIILGGSVALGEHRLALDVDVTFPGEVEFDEPTEAVVDARLGARFRVADGWTVGTGFFTDLRDHQEVRTFGDQVVDWFGLTLGGSMATDFMIADDDPSGADVLRFRSTIAVRYALGVGEVGGLVLDLSDSFDSQAIPSIDVLFHEATIHIGSAVEF